MTKIKDIINNALNGTNTEKTSAFNFLFNEYHPKVTIFIKKRFGTQMTAEELEEVAVETMTKALRKDVLSKWEPRFLFSSWLCKIANNNSIDLLRKKKDKENVTSSFTDLENANDDSRREVILTVDNNSPEKLFINGELKREILKAFDKLNAKNRETAEHYFINQLTDLEVEELTGTKPVTYRCRVNRVKKQLQGILRESGVVA